MVLVDEKWVLHGNVPSAVGSRQFAEGSWVNDVSDYAYQSIFLTSVKFKPNLTSPVTFSSFRNPLKTQEFKERKKIHRLITQI